MSPLDRAIEIAGIPDLAVACGVSRPAIHKWRKAGRLPETEFTGRSAHAAAIAAVTGGQVKQSELLEWSRRAWTNVPTRAGRPRGEKLNEGRHV